MRISPFGLRLTLRFGVILGSVSLLSALAATPAAAECNNMMCKDEHIDQLYVRTNYVENKAQGGALLLSTTGYMSALDCNLVEGKWILIDQKDPMFTSYLSTLTAAKLANKSVTVRIATTADNGGTKGACTLRYVIL